MQNNVFFGNKNAKKLAILIDPDKFSFSNDFISVINQNSPDYLFVGGSGHIDSSLFERTIKYLKDSTKIPVIIFPGDNKQRSSKADGLLLLSVFQSEKKEFIVGQLIEVAKELIVENVPLFPTLYILLDGLTKTNTMQVLDFDSSNFSNSFDEIERYILSAKILKYEYVYLEAGSGAAKPVSEEIIKKSKKILENEMLIVGGGIRNCTQLKNAYHAGADIVVIGNALEENPMLLSEFVEIRNAFLKS
jgi:putative glycerol-1-phosphate prenyltransferase